MRFLSYIPATSASIICLLLSFIAPAMSLVGSQTVAMKLSLGDVAVVGCGVLGTSVCRQLMQQQQSLHFTSLTGITKTTSHHEDIRRSVLGGFAEEISHDKFSLSTIEDIRQNGRPKFQNVIYCAPPSGSADYAKDIEDCITTMWIQHSTQNSKFIFTSSGAVYGNIATVVNETSPVDNVNPRSMRLLQAENVCLSNSGTILRLAGLYTLERGAHSFWLRKGGEIQGRPDGIINLLHYDDAASACVAALIAPNDDVCGKVFLISDGHPMTREEICRAALQHVMYSSTCCMPTFTYNENDPIGRIYDGSQGQKILKWKPAFQSFSHFLSIPSEAQQAIPAN
jgi:nucleoside-diphosphate-sugar epimerase